MKFVCENCKAKYQIGDEKVAGRTLRMKCRRCGHMIQVAATVTESSVSTKLPVEPAAGSAPMPVRATPPPRPIAPAFENESTGDDGATVVRQSPFFMADATAQDAKEPLASPRSGPAAPLRTAPAPPRAPLRSSQGVAPPPRPSAQRTMSPPRPMAAVAPSPASSAVAPLHSPSSPGLHSGFARAVAAPPKPASSQPLPTEDWYVGIGGVPLGPVRLAVLRDKAAAGQVSAESLVWREGFDEWQPVSSFPALLGYLEEAKQLRSSRTSLPQVITPAPRASHTPAPPSPSVGGVLPGPSPYAPAAAAPTPAPSAPAFGPPPQAPTAAQSLPFDLVRSSSLPTPAPPTASPSLNGSVAPGPTPSDPGVNGSATPGPSGYGLTTTAGLTGPATAPSAPPPASELAPTSVGPRKKKGVHPMAWAFVAMAAAFGGVAAWALFLRDNRPEYVFLQSTASPTQGGPLGAAPPPPPTSSAGEELAPGSTSASVAVGPGAQGGPRSGGPLPPGKTSDTSAPIDTTSFNNTVPGPNSTAPPPSSGGGQLTEGEINGVVARNKPGITRRCWTPAYDARSANAPPNAKVNVSLTVGPSGSVQSVSAGGSETHYPGLASCVASSVKAWQFPASDEGAKIAIPFSFSGQ